MSPYRESDRKAPHPPLALSERSKEVWRRIAALYLMSVPLFALYVWERIEGEFTVAMLSTLFVWFLPTLIVALVGSIQVSDTPTTRWLFIHRRWKPYEAVVTAFYWPLALIVSLVGWVLRGGEPDERS